MFEPGVSRELAEARAQRVSNLRYELQLTLPEDPAAPIAARVRLTFTLADRRSPLALDFAPDHERAPGKCLVNGREWDAALDHEHLVIPPVLLLDDANEVIVPFVAGNVPLNRRPGLIYSIFVPARAREAFPCFDQPSLRGRFSLTLDVPDGWTAVSNAGLAGVSSAAGRSTFTFADTPPLPTYLFAFAAGRLLEDVAELDGREFRIYYTAPDTAAYVANREALIKGHAQALAWLEEYTDTRYPFGKFDLVLVPAFQFGGMEHPGAVFYNATTVLLSSSATRQQLLARASVIAHETAHMWFGDLVTMTWFDDVWMKEVFANFMAAKIVEPSFPDLDHDLRFLHAHYPAAYDVDRTAGAHPIRQPLDNLNDAGSLYGAIVYLKSPIVMRQLELLLGGDRLRTALRQYLARHAFASAAWPDLLSILQQHTNHDLSSWSVSWLGTAGRPLIEAALLPHEGNASRIELRGPASHPQHLDVAVGSASGIRHTYVWLQGEASIPCDRATPGPEFILPNGRGLGYGDFILDQRSLDWLTHRLSEIPDGLTRGGAWLTLWDAMLAGRMSARRLFDLGVAAIAREASELNLQRILNDVERTFWLFLSDDERRFASTRLETALQERLGRREQPSVKAAVLSSFRAVATTQPALEWLRALWSDQVHIDGLALRETDYIALTQELAVRSNDGDIVVERQLARTENEDRRSALRFVAPALSANPAAREQFFQTIGRAANRRREPWVVDGLRWLHHPLRAKTSMVFLEPGLELLEDVKRTGDIFLPKRWLDAMLSGHGTPEAAQIVRAFLDSRPDRYPIALRRMVLASGDYLFRASGRNE